ncbi:hypothetical protein K432DRAFT_426701 [Lepidopterella palustris CBS 459.81]|uniref:JmjC domain-containing histone demethylation protein 1 n=1 Tax=Lepidopterella palustris CBS 459.81 TaxID=1314670 RepID=A0A8E2E858_9PEZI|nr:hypothetical protein K432DRAFT_426701 [Lepidopterella palustris CBS 459.81]
MSPGPFKAQFRLPPLRFGTPPPPTDYIEPITPVETHGASFFGGDDGIDHNQHRVDSQSRDLNIASEHYNLHHGHPGAFATSPQRAHQRPHTSSHTQVHGSPIDTLANAASSLAASPLFAQPSRRSSQAPISPTTIPLFPSNGYGTKHSFGDDHYYAFDDRPSKRARSEIFGSPQHHQSTRPATSHIPAHGWSYNVEQMVENGTRMYQDNAQSGYHRDDGNALGKRLSDAQLLLDFHQLGSASSLSRKSHAPMSNGRSPAQPNYPDFASSSEKIASEDTSPHWPPQYRDDEPHRNEHLPVDGSAAEVPEQRASGSFEDSLATSALQTHTPPEDAFASAAPLPTPDTNGHTEPKKVKSHQGWPKGKPRGPRAGSTSSKKKKAAAKAKNAIPEAPAGVPDQLHSPQSLPADVSEMKAPDGTIITPPLPDLKEIRRHSISDMINPAAETPSVKIKISRTLSVPPDNNMTIKLSTSKVGQASGNQVDGTAQVTVCAGCNFTSSSVLTGESQKWINCDGCKGWFHFACAGFQTERDVRSVDKFFCRACKPKHGPTTFVRKSARAHTAVDYAGLNEGVLRTSDENPEHHYIKPIKDGTLQFDSESFPRMPPELVTAEYFEKMNGFREPIVIPASLNPCPKIPGSDTEIRHITMSGVEREYDYDIEEPDHDMDDFEYENVPDDGQDGLDMVIPQGLTVRRVAEMYGPEERVEVIDVKSQEGEDKRWNMRRWADYYEEEGEKVVRNVISLEVSQSKLGRLIRRPKVVRDMDLQDSVWPEDDKANAPKVQFYCLMSVADCYTDFHIDFGGSSVYYHIVKGKKTFFFIPPTKQNLKKYEEWCLSPAQNWTFLPHQVKECYRIDLSEGDTMLIPSGWIHAVWTPENSLVIGGNFLTRVNYGMQIRVAEVEKATKVARKFRYPHFQKVLWFTVLKYLETDPLPQSVRDLFYEGKQFSRSIPIYCEPNKFGHNSDLGPENYNARYYSKAELDGLPDLANYIWRTVMISLGRIEGITAETRNAVTRSIPKGRGDPLSLIRIFAMWTAWKRGNEDIPQWAHPDALLPETGDSKGEKKLSAAALKKLERKSWSEAIRASRDRQPSSRQQVSVLTAPVTNGSVHSGSPAPSPQRPILDNAKHLSTPKTSQLGPKRIACDACRKRRIRCKHKDELIDTMKSGEASSSPHSSSVPHGVSKFVGVNTPSGQLVKQRANEIDASASVSLNIPKLEAHMIVDSGLPSSDFSIETLNNKPGRVKACLDCRKSKRRCIHDEYGNIDPVKASEQPVPRGSASKKRRTSDENVSPEIKKPKKDSLTTSILSNGDDSVQSVAPPNDVYMDGLSYRQKSIPELQDSIVVSSPAKPTGPPQLIDPIMDDALISNDEGNQRRAQDVIPHVEAIISSIERPMGDHFAGAKKEHRSPSSIPFQRNPHTPAPPTKPINNMDVDPSSPLTDIAGSVSPDHRRNGIIASLESVQVIPQTSRRGTSVHKPSLTPGPASSRKGSTPKSAGASKVRRDSKGSLKLEQKSRAISLVETEEEASLRLARELQQEEYGLRRRS